jgi:hypothetical protein
MEGKLAACAQANTPGEIVNRLTAASMPVSAELAQRALRPLELGLVVALVVAALIRESYPTANR